MDQKFDQRSIISRNKLSKWEIPLIYGLALLITIIAWIYFEIQGYPQVVTAKETLTYVTPAIYMIPIFFPLGILLGEVSWNSYQIKDHKYVIINLGGLTVIATVSVLRLISKIPLSGHSLILSYYIMQELITNQSRYIFRVMVGFSILLLTSFYKIFLWQDPVTLFLGLIGGILIWGTVISLCKKFNSL